MVRRRLWRFGLVVVNVVNIGIKDWRAPLKIPEVAKVVALPAYEGEEAKGWEAALHNSCVHG